MTALIASLVCLQYGSSPGWFDRSRAFLAHRSRTSRAVVLLNYEGIDERYEVSNRKRVQHLLGVAGRHLDTLYQRAINRPNVGADSMVAKFVDPVTHKVWAWRVYVEGLKKTDPLESELLWFSKYTAKHGKHTGSVEPWWLLGYAPQCSRGTTQDRAAIW